LEPRRIANENPRRNILSALAQPGKSWPHHREESALLGAKFQHRLGYRLAGFAHAKNNDRLLALVAGPGVLLHFQLGDRQNELALEVDEGGIIPIECRGFLQSPERVAENAYYVACCDWMLHLRL
jgi:hypothetical protein